MKLKPIKKLTGLEYDLSKTVQYTEEWSFQFNTNPFLIGNLITIDVTAAATKFNHGLDAVPLGWLVLDKNSNSNVWRTAWDDKSITLQASANASLKVWVF